MNDNIVKISRVIFIIVCVAALAWFSYKPFSGIIHIDDVSRVQECEIGNNSYFFPPTSIRANVEGEINENALILISEEKIKLEYIKNNKDSLRNLTVFLKKGIVKKNIWRDYYKDYYKYGPGYIYYVPLGVSKGKIMIKWSM